MDEREPIGSPNHLPRESTEVEAHGVADEDDAVELSEVGHPVVVGRHGEAMPIEESEIEVWLSAGQFG